MGGELLESKILEGRGGEFLLVLFCLFVCVFAKNREKLKDACSCSDSDKIRSVCLRFSDEAVSVTLLWLRAVVRG